MLRLLLLVAVVGSLSGCATGITHTVRPGENLYRIGKAYGMPYTKLARINRVRQPYEISPGDQLFIPRATRQLPVNVITPRSASPARPASSVPSVSAGVAGRNGFSWPTTGKVAENFGKRTRGHHDGIDIAASPGTPVLAARAGRVIFSDRLTGYGNVIILEHSDGFASVYAHNEKNLVGKGANIGRGQRIASVGRSGSTEDWRLHFEIRKNNVARNPLYYLPRS
jgi:murein DD-endopeptidase MepM/ murein hydrolase activator NlpD